MWRSTDRQRPSSPTRSSPPNRNRPRPEPPRRAAPTFDPRQHNASTQTLEPTTVNDHRSSPHAIGGTVSTAQIKPCQVTAVGNGPHSVVARRSRRFRRSRRDPEQLIGRPHGRPCFRFAAGLLAVEPHVPASRGKRARRRPRLIPLRRRQSGPSTASNAPHGARDEPNLPRLTRASGATVAAQRQFRVRTASNA